MLSLKLHGVKKMFVVCVEKGCRGRDVRASWRFEPGISGFLKVVCSLMSPALKTRLSYPLVVSAFLLSSGTSFSSAYSC